MRKNVWLGCGLFLLSAMIIMLEVNLTRIFSVTMWYHFSFFAISLALLGIASASIIVFYLKTRIKNFERILLFFSLLCGISIVASFALSEHIVLPRLFFGYNLNLLAIGALLFKSILLLAPFFLAGFCMALLFSFLPEIFGYLYFIDLSGAAFGAIIIVGLLNAVSAPSVMILLACLAFLASLCFALAGNSGLKKWIPIPIIAIILWGAFFAYNIRYNVFDITKVKAYKPSALQKEEPPVLFKKWSATSRITVFPPRYIKEHDIYSSRVENDAGAPTLFLNYPGQIENVDYVKKSIKGLGFALKPNAEVFIIGSGGCFEVLSALSFGAKHVTGVEINPIIVDLLKGQFAGFTRRIYYDPRVTIINSEARNYISGSSSKYDIVDMSMIDTWAASNIGAYNFQENNLYTQEAFGSYWRHLKKDGMLCVVRYIAFDEALRLTATMLGCLKEAGIAQPLDHLIVAADRRRFAIAVAKNTPFTREEISRLQEFIQANNQYIIYAPGLILEEPPKGVCKYDAGMYFGDIRNYIDAFSKGDDSVKRFHDQFILDVRPTTDDRPFFFFMLKKGKILPPLEREQHAARRYGVFLLVGAVVCLLLLSLLLIVAPLFIFNKNKQRLQVKGKGLLILYFSSLGIGYMCIEIPLIQKLSLLFKSPVYSLTVLLFLMLLFSGVGSFVFQRISRRASFQRLVNLIFPCIIMLQLFCIFFIAPFVYASLGNSFLLRLLAVAVLICPMSFFMGMPMSLGISLLTARKHTAMIPWAWAANSAMSVVAASASIFIAFYYGFSRVLYTAVGAYILAFIFIGVYLRQNKTKG